MRPFFPFLLSLLIVLACPAYAGPESPKVVVSISPLHNLVSGIMEGAGEPTLLLPANASPHSHSLRPSDRRMLESADLLIWVGPELEGFLQRTVQTLPDSVRNVSLLHDAGLMLLPGREGGIWEYHHHDHDHGGDHDHDHGHTHDHGHAGAKAPDQQQGLTLDQESDLVQTTGIDAHVWLDPRNAAAMVRHVAAMLIEVDPGRENLYLANRDRILDRLARLDQELQQRMAPLGTHPFIVFHDAYQYFERRYGLSPAGSVTLDPSRAPGAQRIREIRQRIVQEQAICVFREPQFEPRIVQTLIEGTSARTGVLDPIGASLPAGESSYYALLENLAHELESCLKD